jgi:DNA-binding NarL/FixJ family response regulator
MLPDVVVLDVAMPFSNGLELARELKGKFPDTRLVFLTMSEDPDIAAEAFRMGASAYVLKNLAASELSRVMRDVQAGRRYIAPSLAQTVVHSLIERPEDDSKGLTDRQKDVLRLITKGLTMKEVAAALNISTRTVAFHKYQMMRQLGIATSAELIQYAVRRSMH